MVTAKFSIKPTNRFLFSQMHSHFQILLRGVLGVVRKSGRGSSIFVFYCILMIQFFEVFRGGTLGACVESELCASVWYQLPTLFLSIVIFFTIRKHRKQYRDLIEQPFKLQKLKHFIIFIRVQRYGTFNYVLGNTFKIW